ncbi:MAG: DinB family protein [Candidatus Rokubacteria bacterium]|nr:DinB family protein [Candidatus Rokubacteria bacterium]
MRAEQIKAREYLHQKGTLLAPGEIHERVRAAFVATQEFLDSVSEAEAGKRPAPGEWCIQEVVDHLVETHRPSVEELRCLLRGERPAGGPIPASLQSGAPLARPWPALVAELKRLHAEILEILGAVPDGFVSDARAPLVMVVNAKNPDGSEAPLQWIEDLDWKAYAVIFRLHEIDHLTQAKRALRAARPEV